MPISDKHKCIFVHVPKNAGTSIEKALKVRNIHDDNFLFGRRGDYACQHFTSQEIIDRIDINKWRNYFKFALVRNPWDRAVSTFRYLKSHNAFGGDGHNFVWFVSRLDHLREKYADRHPRYCHYVTQSSYIFDSENKNLLDYVGSVENIESDWKTICDNIGEDLILKHHNKSKRESDYRLYYKEAWMVKRIAELYEEDVDNFKYTY